ncbi:hypothetical protein CEUSTIGMA_g534.t1 [Chlamydomonas eustigma]|uniref:mRNA (guanine-N(7))-methyltransferase n=1 Tax=Chlamydomonas eustigma TaxID=1157962 RepID=A0A250WQK6_9CHLO|nr:hypothetical protein CEUSTIGMA_g534.t1 [Chlamydomonas eustigma]|eukprot:GAX73081.1 hypothetical protein CEUSTIGMA_g534.t1 [Chlamydomonas eustigma]
MANRDVVRSHYNAHAVDAPNFDIALAFRQKGRAAALKDFHNDVKRLLIRRFASNADMLLDLCCGRGGDMHKWLKFGVKYVKGLDISEGEIVEAARRFDELRAQEDNKTESRRQPLVAEFEPFAELGEKEWSDGQMYDVVTCNFALHYFFETERNLKIFLHNVALNLKPGGTFLGTIPCGKRVQHLLQDSGMFSSTMLKIQKRWQGPVEGAFGNAYTCAITDTVTEGKGDSEGSSEYLTFMAPIKEILASHGLVPVTDFQDPHLESIFNPGDRSEVLKHFNPRFPSSDPSLEIASAMFGAFVFRKLLNAPQPVSITTAA